MAMLFKNEINELYNNKKNKKKYKENKVYEPIEIKKNNPQEEYHLQKNLLKEKENSQQEEYEEEDKEVNGLMMTTPSPTSGSSLSVVDEIHTLRLPLRLPLSSLPLPSLKMNSSSQQLLQFLLVAKNNKSENENDSNRRGNKEKNSSETKTNGKIIRSGRARTRMQMTDKGATTQTTSGARANRIGTAYPVEEIGNNTKTVEDTTIRPMMARAMTGTLNSGIRTRTATPKSTIAMMMPNAMDLDSSSMEKQPIKHVQWKSQSTMIQYNDRNSSVREPIIVSSPYQQLKSKSSPSSISSFETSSPSICASASESISASASILPYRTAMIQSSMGMTTNLNKKNPHKFHPIKNGIKLQYCDNRYDPILHMNKMPYQVRKKGYHREKRKNENDDEEPEGEKDENDNDDNREQSNKRMKEQNDQENHEDHNKKNRKGTGKKRRKQLLMSRIVMFLSALFLLFFILFNPSEKLWYEESTMYDEIMSQTVNGKNMYDWQNDIPSCFELFTFEYNETLHEIEWEIKSYDLPLFTLVNIIEMDLFINESFITVAFNKIQNTKIHLNGSFNLSSIAEEYRQIVKENNDILIIWSVKVELKFILKNREYYVSGVKTIQPFLTKKHETGTTKTTTAKAATAAKNKAKTTPTSSDTNQNKMRKSNLSSKQASKRNKLRLKQQKETVSIQFLSPSNHYIYHNNEPIIISYKGIADGPSKYQISIVINDIEKFPIYLPQDTKVFNDHMIINGFSEGNHRISLVMVDRKKNTIVYKDTINIQIVECPILFKSENSQQNCLLNIMLRNLKRQSSSFIR